MNTAAFLWEQIIIFQHFDQWRLIYIIFDLIIREFYYSPLNGQ